MKTCITIAYNHMDLFIYFLMLTVWTLVNKRVLGTHNLDISLVIAQMYISLERRKKQLYEKESSSMDRAIYCF